MLHRFAVLLVLLWPLLAGAGCASFTAPRPQTLARLAPMPLAAWLPGRFELELSSPGLTGTFDGVCVAEGASFRLQVFPDVGGKVLDLTVGPAGVAAELPGSHYLAVPPLDLAEPHLALVLAELFAELLAPVRADRVLGERLATGGAVEIQLRPALGAGAITARLAAEGAVASYHFVLGWLDFTLAPDGVFAGRGVRGVLRPVGGDGTGPGRAELARGRANVQRI